MAKSRTIVLTIVFLFLFSINCSNGSEKTIIYEEADFALINWKQKGEFQTAFTGSTFAKWGYIRGSEIGVILYPSAEIADIEGEKAGLEQTELLEEVKKSTSDSGDTGAFYGPNVEKTACRGFDKMTLFRGECPRREPLFTVYNVDGNALILVEPLRTENIDSTKLRLDNLIQSLKDKIQR